ncbi:MAG TPA: methyltransferase domain-containing protein [Acidimicrobiales bacterium]|nr:methyltransferase domain-containing protein [Acidimicrobiales bacterium]
MTGSPGATSKYEYHHYPKTLAPDDFWGQVRRTVNGQRVGEDQILMIVEAIRDGLELGPTDVVLDIACGNGALSARLFPSCAQLLGVDHSEYLVEVAQTYFESRPEYRFVVGDAAGYVATEPDPARFTKALCYGSFPYFPAADAEAVLEALGQRFCNVERIFIGNLPDRDRTDRFYTERNDYADELDDHTAQIGIWRSAAQIEDLAARHGWRARFHQMQSGFYAHHYRFDAILDRCR